MAEALSPDPNTTTTAAQRQRLPPMQRPIGSFFLGSNDDHLERTQARAARVGAVRRCKSLVAAQRLDAGPEPCLNKQQILDLFHNCIKLASENKINQKNTWELNLIDHLTHIIRAEEDDDDVKTNFQMASCTIEAGIKIYSLRVDSTHATAYKVLSGMNRAGQEAEHDATLATLDSVHAESGPEKSRKVTDRKLSPLSTLESSFEVLNVKKFDAAFTVDPLYRQTSAQFDEGGAKGLLMNNLGVYGRCRVLFDSLEVPEKCIASQSGQDISDTIDLSFARDCIDHMVLSMHMKNEISPTLSSIVNLFDENNKRPSEFHFCGQKSAEEFDATVDCETGTEREEYENCQHWHDNHDDQTSVADLGSEDVDPNFPSYCQDEDPFLSKDSEDILQNVDGFLFSSLGFLSKKNAWAGPDHWKYQTAKGSEVHCTSQDGLTINSKQSRQVKVELSFENFFEKQMADIFAPPKNPKWLLLPENRLPCNTKLPEDCHYEPDNLVKLFLLPDIKCLRRRGRKFSDVSREQYHHNESFPSWDNGDFCDDEYEGDVHSYEDDKSKLISQPRQINKIEVRYDKTSKQVDVQGLKITLWDHIQEYVQFTLQGQQETVSFRHILANFPNECSAAATVDISPHLCFMCLLHLANEKGLSIQSSPNLDDLTITLLDVCATTSGIED